MAESAARQTVAFIVRLWAEPANSAGDPIWRGQIERVGSSEIAYFQVPTSLLAFLGDHMRAAPPASAAIEDAGPVVG